MRHPLVVLLALSSLMYPLVSAAQDEAAAVEVLAYAGDPLGERLIYRVKEEIRKSQGMRLTDYSEPRLQVMINTTSARTGLEKNAAAYSVLWLYAEGEEAPTYLSDSLGVFTSGDLEGTAEGIVARSDQLLSEIRRVMLADEDWRELENAIPREEASSTTNGFASVPTRSVALNPAEFVRPDGAASLIKGRHGSYGIWVDDSKWKIAPAPLNPYAELNFVHADGDVYAMVIAERAQVEFGALVEVFYTYIYAGMPDAQTAFEERRTVNGNECHAVRLAGTVQGMPTVYNAYLYAGKAGTVQVLTFTGANLSDQYESDMMGFMNGFVVLGGDDNSVD